MSPFYVIEDNTGILALAVYNGDHTKLIYLNKSYASNPGMLLADLKQLKAEGDQGLFWDGNEITRTKLEHPERLETWFPEEEQKSSYDNSGSQWRIIASENGIWPEQMLDIGRRELPEKEYRKLFPKRGKKDSCRYCPYNIPVFIGEIQGDLCEGLCSPEGCYLAKNED